MRYLLVTLLISSTIASAEVFKTINPDGSVTYSDVQTEGAKEITPPGLTPVPGFKIPEKAKQTKDENNNKPLPYQLFRITSPISNQTLRDNNGNINISLEIKPELQTKLKHTVSISLNGRVVAKNLTAASHKLKDVYRGRHSISAKLIDANGAVLKSSNLVFINMRRFSALNKQQIDNRQTQPDTNDGTNDNNGNGSTPSSTNQNPWPSLPDYSKPENVWPTPPGTPTPPASP